MPDPAKYQDKDKFMNECISARQHEHPDEDNKQSVAVCFSMWREAHGGSPPKQFGQDTPALIPAPYEEFSDFLDRCVSETGDPDGCWEAWDMNGRAIKDGVMHKTHVSEVDGMDFVLSDATPDRIGDIIQPDGWDLRNFVKNPVALFNHNPNFVIGRWANLAVKNGGLRGTLQLAPAGTSARIDEIRKLVEAGILKAVSVGFRPIEAFPLTKDNPLGGQRYMKSELVETSLVAVPANPNALAIAKSLKVSDDTMKLVFAKHGNKANVITRGATGKHATSPPIKRTTMQLAQRIKDGQAEIVRLQDELNTHLSSVDDNNPDEAATALTEELTQKIEVRQKSLDALKKAEARLVAATVTEDENQQQQNGNGAAVIVRNPRPFALPIKKVEPYEHVYRAITVKLKHWAEGQSRPILDVLKQEYGDNDTSEITRRIISTCITKTASIPADTVTSGWADKLVQTVIGEFIASLMPVSVYPKLSAKGGTFTFGRNGVISLPARDTTKQLSGAFVAQGAAIPVKQGAFTAITLTPKKMGVITTMTREITEHSTPAIEGILRQAIMEDTAIAIDTVLLDATAATTTRPAGLKAGVSATSPTAGGGLTALIGDLKALSSALITGTNGNIRAPVWIMSPADLLAASLTPTTTGDLPFRDELARGTMLGYPVIQTTTGTSDTMFLIDAADFITATGDTPQFSVSDQAVLHMEDTNPAQIASVGTPNTVAAPTRSLWQTDTIGIRMILDINWAMQRTGAVAWMQTMTWN